MRCGSTPVSMIVSTERSGIDRYAQELAKRLPVDTIYTSRYRSIHQLRLATKLGLLNRPVHLPNQHLARWVEWLSQPSVVTVHDLVRLSFPYTSETRIGALGLALDRRGIRKAAHVISVSKTTKRDLMHHLDVPEDKITVIHDGIDHSVFKPWHDESSPGCSPPYLLYVGSERPRKNLLVLLRAFSLLRKQGRPFDSLTLLKIGSPGRSPRFRKQTIKEASRLGIDRQIHFVDRMSDRELAGAYSNAVALVYPSLYEGFGLPIVEAMACGCPVVTSNVSSIPEIAGSAALLVDPNDAKGLAEALGSVILRQDLRASLRAKGLRRATEFSWDRTAEATFAVYQRIFSGAATDAASLKKETRARAFHVDVQHQSLTPPRTAESSGRTS